MSKNEIKQKIVWWLLILGYSGCIVWVTLLNRRPSISRFDFRLFWAFRELASGQPLAVENAVQYIYNIILFIPFGFLLSIVVEGEQKKVILIGIAASSIIEIIQYIRAIGLAEIDDVISNTLGVYIGLVVWKRWRVLLVRKQGIYEKYIKRSK